MIRSKPANIALFLIGTFCVAVTIAGVINAENSLGFFHDKMILSYVLLTIGAWITIRAAINLRRSPTESASVARLPNNLAKLNLLALVSSGVVFAIMRMTGCVVAASYVFYFVLGAFLMIPISILLLIFSKLGSGPTAGSEE